MRKDLSVYSTVDLLRMIRDAANDDDDFAYEADICLFRRWRDGIDLDPLIELLESKITGERLRGAYYLGEAIPRGDLKGAAEKLASDSLAYCRRTFVGYMTNTGLYSEAIAVALADRMLDLDQNVRIEIINWAVYTTDDRFADFAQRVESASADRAAEKPWGESDAKRALRGLSIARRLRDGEAVAEIRKTTSEEDSNTFDYFQVFTSRLEHYAERRKTSASTAAAGTSTGYDEFEVGVLGEEYDNLGKLKSVLW